MFLICSSRQDTGFRGWNSAAEKCAFPLDLDLLYEMICKGVKASNILTRNRQVICVVSDISVLYTLLVVLSSPSLQSRYLADIPPSVKRNYLPVVCNQHSLIQRVPRRFVYLLGTIQKMLPFAKQTHNTFSWRLSNREPLCICSADAKLSTCPWTRFLYHWEASQRLVNGVCISYCMIVMRFCSCGVSNVSCNHRNL